MRGIGDDDLQERPPIGFHLLPTDALDREQLLGGCGPPPDHLQESRVVEDHIGGNALLIRSTPAQPAQRFKEWFIVHTDLRRGISASLSSSCLLYTSDAADDLLCVDLGGRRIIKKKNKKKINII